MKHSANESALILANGDSPSKALFDRIRRHHVHFLCADGGANAAASFNVIPDVIIGDLDSVSRTSLRKCRGAQVLQIREQDSTDLEKAFRWCIDHGITQVDVLGATGGRLDHAIGNLSALAKFAPRLDIRFLDDACEIIPVRKSRALRLSKGTTISLVPLIRCSGITTTGLRWNLHDESLALGMRESTSNVVQDSGATVSVKRGILLLCVVHRGRGRKS